MSDDLLPVLPAGYAHLKIDVADSRYVAARDWAKANGLSQKAFSDLLGVEARSVVARQAAPAAAAPAAPAKAAPAPIPGYSSMSFSQRWVAGENARKAKG